MSFGVVYPGSKAVLERYFTTPTPFNGGKGTPHVAFPIWLQINDLDTLDGEWVKVRGLKPQELNQTLSRIAAHVSGRRRRLTPSPFAAAQASGGAACLRSALTICSLEFPRCSPCTS